MPIFIFSTIDLLPGFFLSTDQGNEQHGALPFCIFLLTNLQTYAPYFICPVTCEGRKIDW